MLVSVIVPAYKQEKSIKEDIESIHKVLSESKWDFEIIVVVDGFVDKTFQEAEKVDKKNVKVTGYRENRGKGYAIKFGMSQSKGDWIAFVDSGMDIDRQSIRMLLEHMEWYDADIVIASKRHPVSKVHYPLIRRIYSLGYFTIVKFLFGLKLTDTQTGLKVFKREVLEEVLPRLLIKTFAFDIEILAVSRYLGFTKIYESPVRINWDESSTSFNGFLIFEPSIRRMIADTFAVFYRLKITQYYDDTNKKSWVYKNLAVEEKDVPLPMFSIVIIARRLNNFLKENVSHLKKLDYPNFEVLIVLDDVDSAVGVEDTRLKFYKADSQSPGGKRNQAVAKAKGEIIAFLDDDAYPRKDWLYNAAKIFKDEEIYALGAPAVTPLDASFLEKMSGKILESPLTSGGTAFRHTPVFRRYINDYPTVNLFVRKQTFESIGGFTEEFWPGEDTKLCLDLVKKFKREFIYDPRPIVYHHRRRAYLPLLKQISRYGMHRGQFARIFPETSRNPSYFVPSFFVLGFIIGPILAYYYWVLWYPYLAALTLYLYLLLKSIVRVSIDTGNPALGFLVGFGIFLTHLVYGVNFMIGFVKRPGLKLRSFDRTTGNYLGG